MYQLVITKSGIPLLCIEMNEVSVLELPVLSDARKNRVYTEAKRA
jgi:hypothetical protein